MGALEIDDNKYPKHMWSFALRGREFQQFGPKGYALAHLVDHKVSGNRGDAEIVSTEASEDRRAWFGLYTSAANAAYVPTALLRPTDFATRLRNLFQRRAFALYGEFCNLLPPGHRFMPSDSEAWALEAFPWAPPVGKFSEITAFQGVPKTGLLYSSDPEATRRFFREAVKLPGNDIGDGWWIFDLPEGDLGVHPTGGVTVQLYEPRYSKSATPARSRRSGRRPSASRKTAKQPRATGAAARKRR